VPLTKEDLRTSTIRWLGWGTGKPSVSIVYTPVTEPAICMNHQKDVAASHLRNCDGQVTVKCLDCIWKAYNDKPELYAVEPSYPFEVI
jgi:hypothetical protein